MSEYRTTPDSSGAHLCVSPSPFGERGTFMVEMVTDTYATEVPPVDLAPLARAILEGSGYVVVKAADVREAVLMLGVSSPVGDRLCETMGEDQ